MRYGDGCRLCENAWTVTSARRARLMSPRRARPSGLLVVNPIIPAETPAEVHVVERRVLEHDRFHCNRHPWPHRSRPRRRFDHPSRCRTANRNRDTNEYPLAPSPPASLPSIPRRVGLASSPPLFISYNDAATETENHVISRACSRSRQRDSTSTRSSARDVSSRPAHAQQ